MLKQGPLARAGTGLELTARLRAQYADRRLKIAAVTADVDIVSSDEAKIFDAILLKPVTLSQIRSFLAS